MTRIYIGADDEREVVSILNNLIEKSYINYYIEESIKKVDKDSVDYENAYTKGDRYSDVGIVYDYTRFEGDYIYSVDVEE